MIFGVQYERMPNPRPDDWDMDLKQIAEMGMSVIRTWIYWRKVNPSPGIWSFGHYDILFDTAKKYGIKVQIQLFCEAPPDYLIDMHPEWAYKNQAGISDRYYRRSAQQVGGFQGFDHCHPQAQKAAVDYITRVCEHYRDNPALFGYDVWNEVWMSQWLDGPYSRAARIEFLKTKYKSLEELNTAWLQDYTDWEQVDDPRPSAPFGLKTIIEGLHIDNMDMIAFENHIRAEHMRWRCEAVRRADPGHPAASHIGSDGGRWEISVDEWKLAAHTDIWGVSGHTTDLKEYAMACHVCSEASTGKEWWLAENSSGRLGLGFHGRQRKPEFIKSTHTFVLMHQGAANIFWQYRPEIFGTEAPNFGLTGLDGEHNPRSRCVEGLVKMHEKYANILNNLSFDSSEVGLVCSPVNFAFSKVEEKNVWGDFKADFWENFRGWYNSLCHAGFMPQMLKDEKIVKDGIPQNIRVLIAPTQVVEITGLKELLKEWVKKGGTLIGGPWFELFDRGMYARRQVPDVELFGVKELDFDGSKNVVLDCFGDLYNIKSLPAGDVIEQLEMHGAEPLAALDGRAAAASFRLGKGCAVYLGCMPGVKYDYKNTPQLGMLIEAICKNSGVIPPVRATGGCFYRRGESPEGALLLMVNPHKDSVVSWIEGFMPESGKALDLLNREEFDLSSCKTGFPLFLPGEASRIILFK